MSDASLYSALSGASAAWRQLDVVSDNVANLSSTGFRAGRVAFRTAIEGEYQQAQATISEIRPSDRNGPIENTGEATHVALNGAGWLTVQGPDGQPQLTRDGRFQLDPEGMLVTADGSPVLGENGPIAIAPGEGLRIDPRGRVFGSLSGEVGQLNLVDGPAKRVGGNRWVATGPLEPATPIVTQGALEGSNVDPAAAMTELVEASRYFEAFQKAMQASDDLTARLNQSGGK